ncbi:unnamed protein product [Peniophora sp. CBMAI 1063]|nr:unnamed protein product [Peniophora sp. CBMAI 1063]
MDGIRTTAQALRALAKHVDMNGVSSGPPQKGQWLLDILGPRMTVGADAGPSHSHDPVTGSTSYSGATYSADANHVDSNPQHAVVQPFIHDTDAGRSGTTHFPMNMDAVVDLELEGTDATRPQPQISVTEASDGEDQRAVEECGPPEVDDGHIKRELEEIYDAPAREEVAKLEKPLEQQRWKPRFA